MPFVPSHTDDHMVLRARNSAHDSFSHAYDVVSYPLTIPSISTFGIRMHNFALQVLTYNMAYGEQM